MLQTSPPHGDPMGTSIFIDSSIITGCSGVIESPTLTSIFQTMPVIGAKTGVAMAGGHSTDVNCHVKPSRNAASKNYLGSGVIALPSSDIVVRLVKGIFIFPLKSVISATRCTRVFAR